MIKWMPLFPFVAALSLLACQDDGPVADAAAEPPEAMLGDRGSTGLAAPANAAAAEAADRAALPPVTAGMGWSVGADPGAFGPAGAEPILTFACGSGGGLVVERRHPATPGAKGPLSFTGSGHVASLPMGTIRTDAPGGATWHGRAEGDMARAVARSFSGTGQVEITLGGTPSLVVPADPRLRQLLARCAAA